ncbi:MAG: iron dicitrate transport regulator FecR [Rhodovulum sulfidophilum]|uniref:Iron dicitrate transport regulator FecR n=1 Tax=Rhodovulum sulfidophilum TaxID=35806 RepID=A0A2W5N699_RHOSU|nr:MAG: iron dicitrate transport regulator FecR [Rhodovulum sulfidophilum]
MERDEEAGFAHPDPVMDEALNWLFTLQARPEDSALRAAFEAWRAEAPGRAEAFASAAAAWDLPEMDLVAREMSARTMPAERRRRGDGATRQRHPRAIAAGLAAAILLVTGLLQLPDMLTRWRSDYATAVGDLREFTLPDGSRMMLNTDSAASIDFEGPERSVTLLRGEAFFDVQRDTARPFRVAAQFADVEVIGTAFSVRTDRREDMIVLERGHVSVASRGGTRSVASLAPGESITATSGRLSPIREVDAGALVSWTEGRLVFADQPLGEVVAEITRYYDHHIILASSRLSAIRVTGSYRLGDPERVVRSLATAAGATVTRLPGGILILR